MNILVNTIGHEISNIKPYAIKKIAPTELIIRNVLMFFIKNEIINTSDAK